jgi:hypothetical protein
MLVHELKELLAKAKPNARVYAFVTTMGASRKLALLRVDHHGVAPGMAHPDFPVELFTPPWHETALSGVSMTAEQILGDKGLTRFDDHRAVRVAVPTDQGFHRALDINDLAFGEGDTMHLNTESWDSAFPIIRPDPPSGDGGTEELPETESEPETAVASKVA